MTLPWGTLGGERVTRGCVYVPGIGVWHADLEMEGEPSLSGRQTLALGDLRLAGSIAEPRSGANAAVASYQLVAGAGGWSSVLPARSYHNDAGVRASTVVEDAAREAGETLGSTSSDVVGADYVRARGPASVTIADIAAGVPWWVDFEGTTRIGARAETDAEADAYEVLEVDAANRIVTLAVDDLTRIGIGSILRERLDAPLVVRSMEIEIDDAGSVRVRAWCGAPSTSSSRLARGLRRFVDHVRSDRMLGVWAYQVVRQNTDGRLELRPVEASIGLPDVGPVKAWPGIAGASATVEAGAEVLVEFVNGDRRKPIVRGFAPKDGSGHVPTEVVLASSGTVKLADAGADDGVAKSSACNDRFDAIAEALDVFCATPAVPNDGGLALQTAVKGVWGPGTPPTPPADVGSAEVFVP